MPRFDCRLPYPPTANKYYRVARSTIHLSDQGRRYHGDVAAALGPRSRGETITGPVAVYIEAWRPDRRKRDLDNLLKPVLDALQNCGVIANDSQVEDLRIYWGGLAKPHGHLLVRVETIGE